MEFALVLPLLLLLLMGSIEFSRIFFAQLNISNASREGVRWAAVGKDDDQIINIVHQGTQELEPEQLEIVIEPEQDERLRFEPVTVTLKYKVILATPFLSSLLPNPFPLQAATTMRVE